MKQEVEETTLWFDYERIKEEDKIMYTKKLKNLDEIIDFLGSIDAAAYVRDYADDAGWQSVSAALEAYKQIKEHANADEIACFADTELAIMPEGEKC